MGEQQNRENEQDREDNRAYAFIMKTLESSLGYRLVWALDRLGWARPNGRTGWNPPTSTRRMCCRSSARYNEQALSPFIKSPMRSSSAG
jgi:hypothetical protein